MKTTELVLIGVGAYLLVNAISGGKITSSVVGSSLSGIGTGVAEGLFVKPYQWSKEQDYIPVIDEIAKGAATLWNTVINWGDSTKKYTLW